MCPHCERPLSLTRDEPEAPYDAAPDPEQQASARRGRRRIALLAAACAVVLAVGGWSWWHFTRPEPTAVSINALTGWSTSPKKAWTVRLADVAQGPCEPCSVYEVARQRDRLILAVGSSPAGNQDVPGQKVRSRLAMVDLASGRILDRSPWLTARLISSCAAGDTILWCSGQDTSSWRSITRPTQWPGWIAMSFDLTTLRPRSTDPISDVDFVTALAVDANDPVVQGSSSESVDWPVAEQTYWFARYGADGKRLWTRTLRGVIPPAFVMDRTWAAGSLTVSKDQVRPYGIGDRNGQGVSLNIKTGAPTMSTEIDFGRFGRAHLTSTGAKEQLQINGHSVALGSDGTGTPQLAPLSSQLTFGARPIVFTQWNTARDTIADAYMGVDARSDGDGSSLWSRPNQVPVGQCGDLVVIRDPLSTDRTADPFNVPVRLVAVAQHSGKPAAQFTIVSSAVGSAFCAPGTRLVTVEPTRVRTFDLHTGAVQSTVALPSGSSKVIGDALLVSDPAQQSLTLVR